MFYALTCGTFTENGCNFGDRDMGTPKATRLSGRVVFFARPFDSRASEMCSPSAIFRFFLCFKNYPALSCPNKKY